MPLCMCCTVCGIPPASPPLPSGGPQSYIYTIEKDGVFLAALRAAGTERIDRLLAHNDNALKAEFQEIKTLAAKERGEEPEFVDTRLADDDMDEAAKNADFLVALHANVLQTGDITKLSDESGDIIKDHQEMAAKHVATLVRLINGSLPDKDVLEALRLSHIGKLNTDDMAQSMLLIMYDVKSSGEDARRPTYRRPSLRKPHLDRMMQLALQSRMPDPSTDLDKLRKNEAIVIFDAGRDGNTTALLSSIKVGDQVLLPKPKCDV